MGGSGGAQQQLTQNSYAQDRLAETQVANSATDRAARDKGQAPAIGLYSALTSGDPRAALTAAAPTIAPIAQGYQASKDSIFNNIAPGAGRDYALTQLQVQKNAATAGVFSTQTAGAYDKLANLGSGLGAFSLQDVGAALSGFQGAGQGFAQVGQMQAADKASTMGFLGSLAGGAGAAAGGGAFGKLCWIAEEIYGVTDYRTHLVRAWLLGPFSESRIGRSVVWLYRKIGRRIAALVRRSSIARSVLTPLFNAALWRAQEYFD